jgi:hypothetical protein
MRVAGRLLLMSLLSLVAASAVAQQPPVHYQYPGSMPPGAIGAWQLQRGGPLPGYFQPVEIKAPAGASVSLAINGQFDAPQPSPVLAGLLIAPVYRVRVTGIPYHEGAEVFPTIELIDRTYPPPDQIWRFPIPVELTQEELELALAGKFVTRVIYLEDPESATPAQQGSSQSWFDVAPGANPLQVADVLGRPVAILRMGGRLPADPQNPDPSFMGACAPWMKPYIPPRPQFSVGPAAPAQEPSPQ